MCNRDKPLLGQLPQCGQVGPHVQFTANQHNLGIGAKLLSLALPLFRGRKQIMEVLKEAQGELLLHARTTPSHHAETMCPSGARRWQCGLG